MRYQDDDGKTGFERAEEGAKRAIDHADSVNSGWSDMAYNILMSYPDRGLPFMTEDVREHADKLGLPRPPDQRSWGGIIRRATRDGKLKRVGYAPMKSPNCNANPKSVWMRA